MGWKAGVVFLVLAVAVACFAPGGKAAAVGELRDKKERQYSVRGDDCMGRGSKAGQGSSAGVSYRSGSLSVSILFLLYSNRSNSTTEKKKYGTQKSANQGRDYERLWLYLLVLLVPWMYSCFSYRCDVLVGVTVEQ